MRSSSPRPSRLLIRHCLTPGIHELDEGVSRPARRPATTCKTRPAPESRPTAVWSSRHPESACSVTCRFHKLALVVMLACVIPMPAAHGSYDFVPALREPEASGPSSATTTCNTLHTATFDFSPVEDMELLAKELHAKERQLLANRESHGIYHEIHAPLLEEMATLALLMNNIHKAQGYKEAVLLLKSRLHQNDSRSLAQAYSQWADWHFNRYLDNFSRPSVLLGAGHDSFLLTLHFSVSDEYYSKALDLLGQEPGSQCERNFVVSRLKALYFAALQTPAMPAYGDDHLPGGLDHSQQLGSVVHYRISPARIRDLLTPDPEAAVPGDPALAKGAALQLVELADWHALFNDRKQAQTYYERAWQTLHVAGYTQQEITGILAFGMPIPEPGSPPQAGTLVSPARGYIDVDIELNALGLPSAVTLAGNMDHDAKVVRQLLRKIRQSRFRPVILDGSARDSEAVALRYFY